jgi:hypothetical protein
MTILSLIGGESPAELDISTQLNGQNATWQVDKTDKPLVESPASLQRASETRDVIIEKALGALNSRHDLKSYRFSVTPRWIPGSLERLDADKITSVIPDGNVTGVYGHNLIFRNTTPKKPKFKKCHPESFSGREIK